MSKIPSSGQAFWRQDTPLPPLTLTTSDAESLTPMEKSIETRAESQWVWMVLAAIVISAVVSGFMTFWMVSRLDGQRWVGWTGQKIVMNGKERQVLVPLFMKPDDLKDLREGK